MRQRRAPPTPGLSASDEGFGQVTATDDPFIAAQRDGLERVGRLLERAQREPDVLISDQTVVAELLDVKQDLLIEAQTRFLATEQVPILRQDVIEIKGWIKRATVIFGAIWTVLVGVVSPVLVAVFLRSTQ
jgi:hypothetical protein